MITDEMLRIAAAKTNDAHIKYLEQDYDSDHQHEFSPEFEKKIKKLKRKADHPLFYRSLQRVASVLLAILIGGSTWLAVDIDARAAFLGWIKEVYETYFVYRFEDNAYNSGKLVDYRPTWLPDGYAEFFVDESEDTIMVAYSNEAGDILKFNYNYAPDETDWFVDASQVIIKHTTINENQAELFMATDAETASTIMWTTQDDTAFYISAYLSETDLIKVAESVQEIVK